jgi:hypothetical protein
MVAILLCLMKNKVIVVSDQCSSPLPATPPRHMQAAAQLGIFCTISELTHYNGPINNVPVHYWMH